MNEAIGELDCETCHQPVTVRASKKGKAYYVCSECGAQFFTRGPEADSLLRAKCRDITTEDTDHGDIEEESEHEETDTGTETGGPGEPEPGEREPERPTRRRGGFIPGI